MSQLFQLAGILGFKITNLARNAPKMVILSCILVVVRLQKPPVMFKLVQNGPRPLHSGAKSTSSGPTGCLKTNWTLFGAILASLLAYTTIARKSVQFSWEPALWTLMSGDNVGGQACRSPPPLFWPPVIWKVYATQNFVVCHFCSLKTVELTTICPSPTLKVCPWAWSYYVTIDISLLGSI